MWMPGEDTGHDWETSEGAIPSWRTKGSQEMLRLVCEKHPDPLLAVILHRVVAQRGVSGVFPGPIPRDLGFSEGKMPQTHVMAQSQF